MEIWKQVPDFDTKYLVSNLGRIKRLAYYKSFPNHAKQFHQEKILKPFFWGKYLAITYRKKSALLHRLVCAAFHERVPGKNFVNHKDGDKLNNKADNLEWCSKSENAKHMYRTGLKVIKYNEESHYHKYSDDIVRDIKKLLFIGGVKQRDIAKECGVSQSLVSCINRGLMRRTIPNPIVGNQP